MATQDASTSRAERNYAASCGKFYTYIHTTSDLAGEPSRVFYVGKGRKGRAWVLIRRNKYWSSIASKHGVDVTICAYWPSEEEAHEHEKFLILCFRDMGIRLANMTDGGEGMSGHSPTPETRKKMSVAGKRQVFSEERRKNISAGLMGRVISDETRQKLREAFIGKPISLEARRKASEKLRGENHPMYGKKHSEESRQKMSASAKGRVAYNKGIPASEESRKKMSEIKRALGHKPWLGKTRDQETRDKIAKSLQGVMAGEKNPFFGKKHSEETIAKMRLGQQLAKAKRLLKPENILG
jgi:hypothetical protein